jgi:SAM-dependent methyltransferase
MSEPIRSIYEAQARWAKVYVDPDPREDTRRCALCAQVVGPPAHLLDLGAGGGATAAALALIGYSVTAIELDGYLAGLADERSKSSGFTVVHGDFYDIPPGVEYELITYFDGFGIGDDQSQIELLDHLTQRLAADGRFLVEIYSPGFWAGRAGQTMKLGSATRTYDFDSATQQMVDTWTGPSGDSFTQRLRCYDPDSFTTLVRATPLAVESFRSRSGTLLDSGCEVAGYNYAAVLRHRRAADFSC